MGVFMSLSNLSLSEPSLVVLQQPSEAPFECQPVHVEICNDVVEELEGSEERPIDKSKWNFAAGTAKVQDIFTRLEVIPVFGIIPSALQVIFSLGQMAYGCLVAGKEDYLEQGKAGFYQGGKNFLWLGCFMPCKIWSANANERTAIFNAFSDEQAEADRYDRLLCFDQKGVTDRLEGWPCSHDQKRDSGSGIEMMEMGNFKKDSQSSEYSDGEG